MDTEKHAHEGENNATPTPVKPDVDASERIRDLRERLYARGDSAKGSTRHELAPLPSEQGTLREVLPQKPVPLQEVPPVQQATVIEHTPPVIPDTIVYSEIMSVQTRRKKIRKWALIFGSIFFVIALGVASVIMYDGGNTISGENISLAVEGPSAVGGGEEVPIQVTVANQNTVSMESVTLIIDYPEGTQSAEEDKELSTERRELPSIQAGQVMNIPIKVRVFGEENQEKEIRISIDYRIAGSNATFKKEAGPYKFKVSTSPVVVSIDSVKSISSGQELELTYVMQSNSPSPLSDLLLKVVYPQGFNFSSAKPETASGEDVWKIATLKPGEKKTFKVKGILVGHADEKQEFTATAGVANDSDVYTLASMLAKTNRSIMLEQPFIDVGVQINGSNDEVAIIQSDDQAGVEVLYKNALDTAIYNGEVEVKLDGNALNEYRVETAQGFYDSTKNTISWVPSEVEALKEILPGQTVKVTFRLIPRDDIGKSPEINFSISVSGERVFEDRASEKLTGTTQRSIKVESIPTYIGRVVYESGPFTNSGPIPPVAEKVTQYSLMLAVEAGTNDITGGEVTAVIPQYVTWLDLVSDNASVTFNATTRTLKWDIGDLDAHESQEVAVQVSFTPSLSQVGKTPTLLETQRFKGTDRFTSTVIRAEQPALTTSLFYESNEGAKDGRVQDK